MKLTVTKPGDWGPAGKIGAGIMLESENSDEHQNLCDLADQMGFECGLAFAFFNIDGKVTLYLGKKLEL